MCCIETTPFSSSKECFVNTGSSIHRLLLHLPTWSNCSLFLRFSVIPKDTHLFYKGTKMGGRVNQWILPLRHVTGSPREQEVHFHISWILLWQAPQQKLSMTWGLVWEALYTVKTQALDSRMAQWEKGLATKPDDPSLISETHMIRTINSCKFPFNLNMYVYHETLCSW